MLQYYIYIIASSIEKIKYFFLLVEKIFVHFNVRLHFAFIDVLFYKLCK